jgi:glutamyl-tRNA synthetase
MLDVSTPLTVRFAPSPTGGLHLGNARTALLNFLLARKSGGRFLLRIEDTDQERSTFAAEAELLWALAWLGMQPDGPVIRQSQRLMRYREVAYEFLDRGLAYLCFCDDAALERERTAAAARGEPPRYSGRCRHLPQAEALARMEAGEPYTIRFAVTPTTVCFADAIKGPVEVPSSAFGDFVLLRSSGWPSYNFAAAVDDADMGITLVLRGEDHLTNTARQILLYQAMGLTPPRFAHHGLLVDREGKKLSKRAGAVTVRACAEAGIPALAVAQYLASISGAVPLAAEAATLEDLAQLIDPTSLGRGSAAFLTEDLHSLAGRVFRSQPRAKILDQLQQSLPPTDPWRGLSEERRTTLVTALLPGVSSLTELRHHLDIFTHPEPLYSGQAIRTALDCRDLLATLLQHLHSFADEAYLDQDAASSVLRATATACGRKGRALYHPIRLALTGTDHGPELVHILTLVPVGALKRRLELFIHPDFQETPCNSTTP